MLHVVCIKAGPKFGPDYPNILFDMVRRNLAEGYAGRFVCFTDDATGLDEGIEVRPLPADLPGWWSKLALFKPGLFPEGDRIVFLDLDTVLTGRIDALCDYSGPFAILRDAFRPNGLQSSVMAWRAGECHDIWESYIAAGCPMDDADGDQAWIEKAHPNAIRLQDAFPEMFVSYKYLIGIPATESVVFFHGKPRPHEVETGWVPLVWKKGGLTRADLTSICNTNEERRTENIRSACRRDVPWVTATEPHEGHVAIVAGGPSMRDGLGELRRRKECGQQLWAVNGTAAFLRTQGLVPDGHVLVDARPENIAFLDGAAPETMHYLASQCAPTLFDAVENVQLWHANSPGMADLLKDCRETALIGGGSTVGLQALALAFALGYRKIHLYGFDSSYRGAEGHAYPQAMNAADPIVTAVIGDRSFLATPWMVQQVEEFQATAAELEALGTTITVHGDGMLPYVANELPRPLTAAQTRAAALLARLEGESPVGAEVGVFGGDMSAALLAREDLRLYMVDSWEGGGAAYTGDSGDFHANLTQGQQDGYRARAERLTAFAAERRWLVPLRSHKAAASVPDGSLDFVFIDADHGYEGCLSDLRSWFPKIKAGGLFSGHDYENVDFPKFGVTRAVNEFAAERGLVIELGENFTWFAKVPNFEMEAA